MATATSVMRLVEQGKIKLSDSIVTYLPEFDNHDKKAITVEHLLRHRTGLIADNPIGDYADGSDKAWERIANLKLHSTPGERFLLQRRELPGPGAAGRAGLGKTSSMYLPARQPS